MPLKWCSLQVHGNYCWLQGCITDKCEESSQLIISAFLNVFNMYILRYFEDFDKFVALFSYSVCLGLWNRFDVHDFEGKWFKLIEYSLHSSCLDQNKIHILRIFLVVYKIWFLLFSMFCFMLYLLTALTIFKHTGMSVMKTLGFLGSSVSRIYVVYRIFGKFCTGFLQVPIYKNAGLHDAQILHTIIWR